MLSKLYHIAPPTLGPNSDIVKTVAFRARVYTGIRINPREMPSDQSTIGPNTVNIMCVIKPLKTRFVDNGALRVRANLQENQSIVSEAGELC